MIPDQHFESLCRLTGALVELRQNECKHLCIENIGPQIFGGLLAEYLLVRHRFVRESSADGQTEAHK